MGPGTLRDPSLTCDGRLWGPKCAPGTLFLGRDPGRCAHLQFPRHLRAISIMLERRSEVGFMLSTTKSRVSSPLLRRIQSNASIWFVSLVAGFAVFTTAVLLQWLIYDDWMHRSGSVRLVGSFLSFGLTSYFVFRWLQAKRAEKLEILRRFETIKWMNDRIRNSLQAIECLVFATNPHVTDPVREAVDSIEDVLQEMLNNAPYTATPAAQGFEQPGTVKTMP